MQYMRTADESVKHQNNQTEIHSSKKKRERESNGEKSDWQNIQVSK